MTPSDKIMEDIYKRLNKLESDTKVADEKKNGIIESLIRIEEMVKTSVEKIETTINNLIKKMEDNYVTKDQLAIEIQKCENKFDSLVKDGKYQKWVWALGSMVITFFILGIIGIVFPGLSN